MSGLIGEAFGEMIKERIAFSLRMRAEQGYHTGGVSFGYTSVPADSAEPNDYKRLEIDEAQAAIVRWILSA